LQVSLTGGNHNDITQLIGADRLDLLAVGVVVVGAVGEQGVRSSSRPNTAPGWANTARSSNRPSYYCTGSGDYASAEKSAKHSSAWHARSSASDD
jgi:hypothetical protein